MTSDPHRPTAVVTGASSGIGAATARGLAAAGFAMVLGARRVDRCRQIAEEIGGAALPLDVTDAGSVSAFAEQVPAARLLVNNAGGAQGMESVLDANEEHWRWMWEANVLGTLRMTRALLPRLVDSGDGHVITVTSIAAQETYDNGAGYTAAKHAQSALHRTLRGEHLGQPVRFTEVAPGAVHTEFSLVRFAGDAERAAQVYAGITPLTARTWRRRSCSRPPGRRTSTSTRSCSSRATSTPRCASTAARPDGTPRPHGLLVVT